MKYPAEIYQLVIDGLQNDFPPLKTSFTGSEPPAPGEAPFKGLQFFDVEDANLFFGREAATAQLVERLRESRDVLVVVGASGSGKSSLVRAGVIPALRQSGATERREETRLEIITPTEHPLQALALALTRESESVTATTTLLDDLMQDPRALHLFIQRQQTTDRRCPSPIGGHFLLVVDQFEELFTLCRDEYERQAFIDNLLYALTPTSPPSPLPVGEGRRGEGFALILTLRADFYAHVAQYPELRDAVARQQSYIGPMTSEELRRAIQEPARARAMGI